jgi:hypothetical protein
MVTEALLKLISVDKQDLDSLFAFNCVPVWPHRYTEKDKEFIQILQYQSHGKYQ